MNEKVFQKSQASIWTFRHFWEILFPSNSYFTEKGHFYIYISFCALLRDVSVISNVVWRTTEEVKWQN